LVEVDEAGSFLNPPIRGWRKSSPARTDAPHAVTWMYERLWGAEALGSSAIPRVQNHQRLAVQGIYTAQSGGGVGLRQPDFRWRPEEHPASQGPAQRDQWFNVDAASIAVLKATFFQHSDMPSRTAGYAPTARTTLTFRDQEHATHRASRLTVSCRGKSNALNHPQFWAPKPLRPAVLSHSGWRVRLAAVIQFG